MTMKHTTTTTTKSTSATVAADGGSGRDAETRRTRRQILVFAAVLVVSMLALVGKTFLYFAKPKQQPIPLLTIEEFDRAKRTWESSGIDSYDMDLAFNGGSNHDIIHLEVRKGMVTTMTKNKKPPAQERTWDEWTVPNQFSMIAADMAKEAHGGFSTREGVVIVLRAEFDPEFGYPKKYVLEVVQGRSPLNSNWAVTHFQAVP
jgi:Family of unknown function (DUF6174)